MNATQVREAMWELWHARSATVLDPPACLVRAIDAVIDDGPVADPPSAKAEAVAWGREWGPEERKGPEQPPLAGACNWHANGYTVPLYRDPPSTPPIECHVCGRANSPGSVGWVERPKGTWTCMKCAEAEADRQLGLDEQQYVNGPGVGDSDKPEPTAASQIEKIRSLQAELIEAKRTVSDLNQIVSLSRPIGDREKVRGHLKAILIDITDICAIERHAEYALAALDAAGEDPLLTRAVEYLREHAASDCVCPVCLPATKIVESYDARQKGKVTT